MRMVVYIIVISICRRVCVWAVFWLVEWWWDVKISVAGWRFGGVDSIVVKSKNIEVVSWLRRSDRVAVKFDVQPPLVIWYVFSLAGTGLVFCDVWLYRP